MAWVAGLGFGIPGAYGLWHLARQGEVWTFLGFPTYGEGLFKTRLGLETTTWLLACFLAVCALEIVAGVLLWQGEPASRTFALALLPLEFVFWIGFALPWGPVLGLARTGFILF